MPRGSTEPKTLKYREQFANHLNQKQRIVILSLSVSLKSRPVIPAVNRLLILFLLALQTLHVSAQQLPELILFRDGKRWGYADTTGRLKITPQYKYADFFKNNFAIVYTDSGAGIINRMGVMILPAGFKTAEWQPDHRILVTDHNDKKGLYDTSGLVILPCRYEDIKQFSGYDESFYELVLSYDSVSRIYSANTKTLLPGVKSCYMLPHSRLLLGFNNNNWNAVISPSGRIIIPLDSVYRFSEKMELFFSRKTELVDTTYYIIGAQSEGLCKLYDTSGIQILSGEYKKIEFEEHGYIWGLPANSDDWILFSKTGELILPEFWHCNMPYFMEENIIEVYRVKGKNTCYNLYDLDKKKLLFPEEKAIRDIEMIGDYHFALFEKNRCTIADTNGVAEWWPRTDINIYGCNFDKDTIIYGYAGKKRGMYNPRGTVLFEAKCEYVDYFPEEQIWNIRYDKNKQAHLVQRDLKTIIVTGTTIEPVQINKKWHFIVTQKSGTGLCSATGEWILPCVFQLIESMNGSNKLLRVQDKKKRTAVYNATKQNWVTGFDFSAVSLDLIAHEQLLFTVRDSLLQIFNLRGKPITRADKYVILMESFADNGIFALGVFNSNGQITSFDCYDTTGITFQALSELIPRNFVYRDQLYTRFGSLMNRFLGPPLYPVMNTLAEQKFDSIVPLFRQKSKIVREQYDAKKQYMPSNKKQLAYFLIKHHTPTALYAALADSNGVILLDSLDEIRELINDYFAVTVNKKKYIYNAATHRFLFPPAESISLLVSGQSASDCIFSYSADDKIYQLITAQRQVIATANAPFMISNQSKKLFYVAAEYPYFVDIHGRVYNTTEK